MELDDWLLPALAQRRQQQRYRQRRCQQAASGRYAQLAHKRLLNFSGNDYLGHANHASVISAFKQAADAYGVGAGASHLVTGHSEAHQLLEEALAARFGGQRALLFSSGYAANLAILSTLAKRHHLIFQDRLNHASLLDAAQLSRARLKRYAHNEVSDLERRLASSEAEHKWVVTDGVFSMDGDIARLEPLEASCRAHQAWLVVDDAHGIGVLGDKGNGSCEGRLPDVLMGTLGKALGCYGAFVVGSEALIDTLIQFARPYIYTTALPPAVAAAAHASLDLLDSESWRRDKLRRLIALFREQAAAAGLDLLPSTTAIQPLLVGDDASALNWSRQLREAGFLVVAIRPPTVPEGSARLRITLSAAHQPDDIERLVVALAQLSRIDGKTR